LAAQQRHVNNSGNNGTLAVCKQRPVADNGGKQRPVADNGGKQWPVADNGGTRIAAVNNGLSQTPGRNTHAGNTVTVVATNSRRRTNKTFFDGFVARRLTVTAR